MPGVYIAAWYNNPSTSFTSAIIMSSKSTEVTNKQQVSLSRNEINGSNVRAPILIFISAHAIGSLGFALSLLSIWFGWLLPTSTIPVPVSLSEPESAEIKKTRLSKHPRRLSQSVSSKAPPLPIPIRRSSAPVDLASILVPHSDESQQHGKRVCFVDSPPLTPITRRNTLPEPSRSSYRVPSLHQLVEASVSSSSAPSTPQTDEHEPLAAAVTAALDDLLVSQSDSSRPPSRSSFIKPTSRFQKLKLGFNGKCPKLPPPQSEQQGDQVSLDSVETNVSDKSTKRASGTFIPPWSITRHRTAPDVNTQSRPSSPARLAFMNRSSVPTTQTNPSPASSTTSLCAQTVDMLSPTFLTRKAQRRTSTPLPRTNPYGAPYFAEPPILMDSKRKKRSSQINRTSRPENEENSAPSAYASDVEGRGRPRQNSIRRVALNPQPPHPLVKQRSASEHTSQRQAICV